MRGERGLEHVAGERVALDESVKAGARVVGMQRDDAVEGEVHELALEEHDLRLGRNRARTGD